MKKILFIRESYGERLGGIQRIILKLALEFHAKKLFTPILATNDKKSQFSIEFLNNGFEVIELPFKNSGGLLSFHRMFKNSRYLINLNILDLFIVMPHKFKESMIARYLKFKNKNLKTLFVVHTYLEGRDYSKFKLGLLRYIDRLTNAYVDSYITISQKIKSELIDFSNVNSKKIKVIYNGVEEFQIKSDANEKLNHQVAVIGELQPRKSQLDVLKMINLLNKCGLRMMVHFFGGNTYNNYKKELEDYIYAHDLKNQIVFHGQVSKKELEKKMKNISVVLLTSKFEGTPTSIIEGMAMKKIVVASNVGATNEIIENNVNGYLYEYGDNEQLKEIFLNIYNSDSEKTLQIRNNAYNTWKKRFSLTIMLDNYRNFIESMVRNDN